MICVICKHVYEAAIFHILLFIYLVYAHICIFIASSLCISDSPSSVQDGQETLANILSLMVVNWVWKFFTRRDSLCCQISHFNLKGLKGVHLVACWRVADFLWNSKSHITFCFTQVNAKNLTLIMSIVLEQTEVRLWWLNLPVNCEIVNLSMDSHSFNLSASWIPLQLLKDDILHHRRVPFFRIELAVTSLLSCILISISHIYGIRLIVIIILSSRLRSLSKRDRRDSRAGDAAATILQKRLIISKAKTCNSHNKDKT